MSEWEDTLAVLEKRLRSLRDEFKAAGSPDQAHAIVMALQELRKLRAELKSQTR